LLATAFEPAFVDVQIEYDEFYTPFVYHLETLNDLENQGSTYRQIGESAAYWSAYVQGAYEGPFAKDNDPDSQPAVLGWNYGDEPEYAFTFFEVIRDLCQDEHPTWNREIFEERCVVHEIGHQFELADDTGGIMERDAENWTSSFTEEHIKAIRSIESP
jgi:hypothetical protein